MWILQKHSYKGLFFANLKVLDKFPSFIKYTWNNKFSKIFWAILFSHSWREGTFYPDATIGLKKIRTSIQVHFCKLQKILQGLIWKQWNSPWGEVRSFFKPIVYASSKNVFSRVFSCYWWIFAIARSLGRKFYGGN